MHLNPNVSRLSNGVTLSKDSAIWSGQKHVTFQFLTVICRICGIGSQRGQVFGCACKRTQNRELQGQGFLRNPRVNSRHKARANTAITKDDCGIGEVELFPDNTWLGQQVLRIGHV